jgi:hypothetical protein
VAAKTQACPSLVGMTPAHVTHILTKLGAARRAEIGAWCATVKTGHLIVSGGADLNGQGWISAGA